MSIFDDVGLPCSGRSLFERMQINDHEIRYPEWHIRLPPASIVFVAAAPDTTKTPDEGS